MVLHTLNYCLTLFASFEHCLHIVALFSFQNFLVAEMLLLRKFLILSERPSDCVVLVSKSLFAKHLRFILSKSLSRSEGSFTHRPRSQSIIELPKSVQRNFSGYWPFTGGISSSVNTRPVEIVQSENGEPELDWEYILDARNMEEIRQNVANRKGVGNIDLVVS